MAKTNANVDVAVAYLEAVGRKDFDAFARLLAPDAKFHGPVADLVGAGDVVGAYRRLAPMLVRIDLKKAFLDDETGDVGVVYDFVTDTSAGAVPTFEWLVIRDGTIRSIWLLTDHVRWPKALAELGARRK